MPSQVMAAMVEREDDGGAGGTGPRARPTAPRGTAPAAAAPMAVARPWVAASLPKKSPVSLCSTSTSPPPSSGPGNQAIGGNGGTGGAGGTGALAPPPMAAVVPTATPAKVVGCGSSWRTPRSPMSASAAASHEAAILARAALPEPEAPQGPMAAPEMPRPEASMLSTGRWRVGGSFNSNRAIGGAGDAGRRLRRGH